MTKEKQCISGDNLTVCGSNERSLVSGGETSSFDLIPVDLVINNILSRLPVKSLAQCRCVSKQWSSIIRCPNYSLLFPTKSPAATPRLLFVFQTGSSLFFFSSPQPQNPDKKKISSPSLLATRHTNCDIEHSSRINICPPVNGLVCIQHIGIKYSWALIYNPITGEYVTTPKVELHRIYMMERIYFGYDPIGKQFKVLRSTWLLDSHVSQVLTLWTRNLSWRTIQCCTLHDPYGGTNPYEGDGICIDGVLYYQVIIDQKRSMVCFDVRSEKLSFINLDQDMKTTNTSDHVILIDYKGKLGVIHYTGFHSDLFGLWVLENAEEHKWFNMHQIQRPSHLVSPFSVAMIGGGEIVFYEIYARNRIFCYNLERNIIRTISLQVPELYYIPRIVYTFPNFVEDVKLM